MRLFTYLLFFTFLFVSSVAEAQTKTTKKTFAQYKPPRLTTLLGSYKDSVSLGYAEAGSILSLPLNIVDDKKLTYAISSYQFLYRKNVVTEEEETGKVSATTSILSERFRTSPLPDLWITKISDEIKAGEFLYFFDIIVKDKQGRVMYAPDLKISIK